MAMTISVRNILGAKDYKFGVDFNGFYVEYTIVKTQIEWVRLWV